MPNTKCKTTYENCPLMDYLRSTEILRDRIVNTPHSERGIVEDYDSTNLIKCLDECHVTGAPPNPAHHQTWQMIWVENHGIYNSIGDRNQSFTHFINTPIMRDDKRLSLTWREGFEIWYASRYITDEKIEEIKKSPLLYAWSIGRLSEADRVSKKLDSNYSPVEAAIFLDF